MAKLTPEQRSQAAKKGWKTRRTHMLERGEISAEKYFDYYEELPTGYTLYDETGDSYEFDDIDSFEDYDNSDDYITQGELIDKRINDTLDKCVTGNEMAKFVLGILDVLKETDKDDYYKRLTEHEEDIDKHLQPYQQDYNTFDMYESGIALLDYASGVDGYGAAFEATFKDARRNDAFNAYHRRHPNAKYGKRRKSY